MNACAQKSLPGRLTGLVVATLLCLLAIPSEAAVPGPRIFDVRSHGAVGDGTVISPPATT